MKTIKEITDRIEYTYDAMIDLDKQGNHKEANKLSIKIDVLEWVIEQKWVNKLT
ncbi:hypothetical protein LCGC14_2701200 [marine sediment metagenome]|uniref:Uncharacterized protein n=1 Tax=marine sediment metagenome TaxID=412755 RepID=A0A0F9A3A8_9ZZZZ